MSSTLKQGEKITFTTGRVVNKINKKTQANARVRFFSSMRMLVFAFFFLTFSALADPRKVGRNSIINGPGFASFLPLWCNAMFAIFLILMILYFTYEVARELNNCFLKIRMTSTNMLVWLLLLLPQLIPSMLLIISVYFEKIANFMNYPIVISIYFTMLFLSPLLIIPYRILIKDSKNNTKFNRIFFPIISIFISLTLIGFFYLTIVRGWTTILFFMLIPVFADTGAYFAGMFFGRHKMAPVLSPKKTWEGLIGGVLVAFLISFLVLYLYGFGEKYNLQVSVFGMQWTYEKHVGPGSSGWWCIAFVLISVAIATSIIGDLAFSLFKRKNNIKDYGNFIAGHGGILDRFDSWLIEIGVLHFILITISLFSTIFLGFDKSHNRIFNVV